MPRLICLINGIVVNFNIAYVDEARFTAFRMDRKVEMAKCESHIVSAWPNRLIVFFFRAGQIVKQNALVNKVESVVALLGGLSKVDMAVLFGNLNKARLALYQLWSTWSGDILRTAGIF